MNRRRFLALAAGSSTVLAGCSESASTPPATDRSSPATPTTRGAPTTATATPTETQTASPTDTPRQNPHTLFVDSAAGAASASGTRDDPFARIQDALAVAQPGDTVQVTDGVYREPLIETVRAGRPDAPITITGSEDAVLKTTEMGYKAFDIQHSHIHLTGLTIDGLENPDRPDTPSSYSRGQLIRVYPPKDSDEYLRDIVIAPQAIGGSQKHLIGLDRTIGAEVGPFRVIGPAGAKYLLEDGESGVNAEIVYVGTSPSSLGSEWHPWTDYDRTRNVYIHHIDNSAGYPHSELVNAKLGTHNVTVEYCTDGGGSQNTADYPSAAIRLQSYGATVRWCDLQQGSGHGVFVGSYQARDAQQNTAESELTVEEKNGGTDNEIYGNRVVEFAGHAFRFPLQRFGQTPAAQAIFCGNTYTGETDGTPDASCGAAVPSGSGIGHTGGDSPGG